MINNDEDPSNKLWRIVKYNNNVDRHEIGVKLWQGDTIKLGRIRYKVKEIHRGIFQVEDEPEDNNQTFIANTDVKISANHKSVTPQINNYIKHPSMIKQFRNESLKNKQKSNGFGKRLNQIFNSK